MPTDHEFAQMSGQVYRDGGGYVPNWDVKKYVKNTLSSFCAAVYHNKTTNETVIAFRGTDTGDPLSRLPNLYTEMCVLLLGLKPNTLANAQTFWQEHSKTTGVLDKFQAFLTSGRLNSVFFTGHSLGGALAELLVFETYKLGKRHHAVTFESPGCAHLIQKEYHDELKSRITCYLTAPNRINTRYQHLGTLYRLYIDHASPFDLQYNIMCVLAATLRLLGCLWLIMQSGKSEFFALLLSSVLSVLIPCLAFMKVSPGNLLSSCLKSEGDWLSKQHSMSAILGEFKNEDGLPQLRGKIHSWPSFSQYNFQHTLERSLKNLIPFSSQNYGIRMITKANQMFENQIDHMPGYVVEKEILDEAPKVKCTLL